jgi:flagellar assembly factor FliW
MESTTGAASTTVELPRFGECTYAESDVIAFPWGIPGFADQRRWLALTLETQPNFVWLQSLDDVSVALPTATPWAIFDSYEPKIPTYAWSALDISDPSDFTLLNVLVVTPKAENMTMNLAAPIVVNLRTRKALQVVCDSPKYSSRELIPRRISPGETLIAS